MSGTLPHTGVSTMSEPASPEVVDTINNPQHPFGLPPGSVRSFMSLLILSYFWLAVFWPGDNVKTLTGHFFLLGLVLYTLLPSRHHAELSRGDRACRARTAAAYPRSRHRLGRACHRGGARFPPSGGCWRNRSGGHGGGAKECTRESSREFRSGDPRRRSQASGDPGRRAL